MVPSKAVVTKPQPIYHLAEIFGKLIKVCNAISLVNFLNLLLILLITYLKPLNQPSDIENFLRIQGEQTAFKK